MTERWNTFTTGASIDELLEASSTSGPLPFIGEGATAASSMPELPLTGSFCAMTRLLTSSTRKAIARIMVNMIVDATSVTVMGPQLSAGAKNGLYAAARTGTRQETGEPPRAAARPAKRAAQRRTFG